MTVLQSQNVNDVIDHLAAKLSVPAAHLWAVLIRQQHVDVIQCVVFAVFVVIGCFAWRRQYLKEKAADPNLEIIDFSVFLVAGGTVVLLSGIAVSIWAFTAVGELVNPEYYALKEILGAFR